MNRPRQDIFRVPPHLARQPLAAALRKWHRGRTWADIRRMLRDGCVLVDGNLATNADQPVMTGQVIKLLALPRLRTPTEDDVRIRYADADVVVVEKPAGMTSIRHPDEARLPARQQQRQPTLTELLPRILARRERARGGAGQRRSVRAVHRLDRETSGLMVFARNVKAEQSLGRQFRDHSIRRVYWAIVAGRVEPHTIESQLVRDRGDGRRGSSAQSGAGKRAVTHVKPLEHLPRVTLVECILETGRTHQIRIHLAERGNPVCGDKVYRSPHSSRAAGAIEFPRLALHAGRLGFVHPTQNRLLEFESPLPAELAEMLAAERNTSARTRKGNPQ